MLRAIAGRRDGTLLTYLLTVSAVEGRLELGALAVSSLTADDGGAETDIEGVRPGAVVASLLAAMVRIAAASSASACIAARVAAASGGRPIDRFHASTRAAAVAMSIYNKIITIGPRNDFKHASGRLWATFELPSPHDSRASNDA